VLEEAQKIFVDAAKDESRSIYKKDAFVRSSQVSDVSYKLAYALNRGGNTFEGNVTISFYLTAEGAQSDEIYVDYRGEKVHSLGVNGTEVTSGNPFHDHRVYFAKEHLKEGSNTAIIRFTTRYVRDCEGANYFKDNDDGEEYIYTDCEPANQHKIFPCFDQPDIKASYTLLAVVPKGWHVFANSPQNG